MIRCFFSDEKSHNSTEVCLQIIAKIIGKEMPEYYKLSLGEEYLWIRLSV